MTDLEFQWSFVPSVFNLPSPNRLLSFPMFFSLGPLQCFFYKQTSLGTLQNLTVSFSIPLIQQNRSYQHVLIFPTVAHMWFLHVSCYNLSSLPVIRLYLTLIIMLGQHPSQSSTYTEACLTISLRRESTTMVFTSNTQSNNPPLRPL